MESASYLALTLQHFQCFILVAEQGTMIKAAESMNVSQPLVSQKIAQLENELGAKLFDRYKRKLLLTEAGKQFLADCKSIMSGVETAVGNIRRNYQNAPEQLVKIGFSDGHEPSGIKNVVDKLKESFPDTIFDIEIENRLVITEKLLDGDIDIAYMVDTERLHANKNINYRKLYQLSVNCIVNKSGELACKQGFGWQDLDGLTCYWPSSLKNTLFTKDILRFVHSQGIRLMLEIRDVDYFTLRRYLHVSDCVTLSLSRSLDDPLLKLLPLGGLTYPFIIAWKSSKTKELERFVDRFVAISKSVLKA